MDETLQMVLPALLLHNFLQPGFSDTAGSHSRKKPALCLKNSRVKNEVKPGIFGSVSFGFFVTFKYQQEM